jgi:hypothetical protein
MQSQAIEVNIIFIHFCEEFGWYHEWAFEEGEHETHNDEAPEY